MDGSVVRKKGGMAVLEWLVRQLNLSFDMRVVPIWTGVLLVECHCAKGKVTNVNVQQLERH